MPETNTMKFYKCMMCGSIVAKLNEIGCDPSCCGEVMKELKPGTVEAAVEKHIPVAKKEGNRIHVEVGSVIHPMLENHYIEWVYLLTNKGGNFRFFKPGEEPKADFLVAEGEEALEVYAYCNLHGLWVGKID